MHRIAPFRRSAAAVAAFMVAAASLVFVAGPVGAASTSLVCSSGDIASGTYSRITITGTCTIPDGATVTVTGNVLLRAGATLNAITVSTIHVRGNIVAERGANLGLGCTVEGAGCTAASDTSVGGNIVAIAPLTIDLDGAVVGGSVVSVGGGPGVSSPNYQNFAVKDNRIGGNLVLLGWQGGWMGAIRNQVGGNVLYAGNANANPDGNEIVANTIGANLICLHNSPQAQLGDAVEGAPPGYGPNHVGGRAIGECAKLVGGSSSPT